MNRGQKFISLMGGISLLASATAAMAQDRAEPEPQIAEDIEQDSGEAIVVTGSQIKGADVAGALPLTLLNEQDIDAIAATSGDDLFRAIPQAGDVAFNESRDAGGINDARGDVASINLRALGTGNTLVLLNGRRMVLHPGTQSENLVPVQSGPPGRGSARRRRRHLWIGCGRRRYQHRAQGQFQGAARHRRI
jgi:iron complex outermembrane receptor protein